MAVSVVEISYPVLVGIVVTTAPCGINMSQEVGNKQKSTSPGLVRQPPNLDAVVDGKFPDDMDSASIFSKVIGDKLSYGSFGGLYMSCRMSFAADPVQTKTSEFMDLGFSTINALYEASGLSNPADRI